MAFEHKNDSRTFGVERQQEAWIDSAGKRGFESIVDNDERGPFNLPKDQPGLSSVS